MKYLTFALTKGRLASKTLEMLEAVGIRINFDLREQRAKVRACTSP